MHKITNDHEEAFIQSRDIPEQSIFLERSVAVVMLTAELGVKYAWELSQDAGQGPWLSLITGSDGLRFFYALVLRNLPPVHAMRYSLGSLLSRAIMGLPRLKLIWKFLELCAFHTSQLYCGSGIINPKVSATLSPIYDHSQQ